jgi:hypothetical protein
MHHHWAAAISRAAVVASCAFMAACAPLHHKPLAPNDRQRIQQVELQVVVPQETFVFSANTPGISVALGGGLIPALIDASVQKSRQEAMSASIRTTIDKVIDLDFRSEVQAAFADALKDFPLPVASTTVTPVILPKALQERKVAAANGGKAYLRLLVHYALDPNTMQLTTRTHALLWQDGKIDPSYAGALVYQGQPKTLAVDGPGSLRDNMRHAAADTLRMLALDVAAAPRTGDKPKTTHPMTVNGQKVQLPSERIGGIAGTQDLLRAADGALVSVRNLGVAP